MNIAGYRVMAVRSPGGVRGESGIYYDYIMAGNGLFVQAENDFFHARIPIAEAQVRGLPSTFGFIEMKHGKVPQRFWGLILSVMLANPDKERYAGIRWQQGYQLYVPEQEGGHTGVTYKTGDDVLIEFHSHPGKLSGHFSGIDNGDEQGMKVFGLINKLDYDRPEINLRVGVYGYFMRVRWTDIFQGSFCGALECMEDEQK